MHQFTSHWCKVVFLNQGMCRVPLGVIDGITVGAWENFTNHFFQSLVNMGMSGIVIPVFLQAMATQQHKSEPN